MYWQSDTMLKPHRFEGLFLILLMFFLVPGSFLPVSGLVVKDVGVSNVYYIALEFEKKNNIDLRKDPKSLQRLIEAAEKSKMELSSTLQSEINLPYITVICDVPKHHQ